MRLFEVEWNGWIVVGGVHVKVKPGKRANHIDFGFEAPKSVKIRRAEELPPEAMAKLEAAIQGD